MAVGGGNLLVRFENDPGLVGRVIDARHPTRPSDGSVANIGASPLGGRAIAPFVIMIFDVLFCDHKLTACQAGAIFCPGPETRSD
jgi:hypothetical protein